MALAAPLVGVPRGGATTTSITTSLSSAPGAQGSRTSFSFRPWVSGDGRYVGFDSDSSALVAGDTNRVRDVFVYDRDNQTLERVSTGPAGKQADGDSQRPTLSTDGRWVAFWSAADNLVEGDTNKVTDCFLHDRQTQETTLLSVGPDGAGANGECARPVISGDGRIVAFEAAATNLEKPNVLGQSADTNKARDVFVRDLDAGTTTRVSVSTDAKQGTGESVRPAISGDGRFVAFQSESALQADDTNKKTDVYVHDRDSHETTRISTGPGAVEGNGGSFSPSVSSDGRFVSYWSNASNVVAGDGNGAGDVFVFDRNDGSSEKVSAPIGGGSGNGPSSDPSISPDGRFVAFWSGASNLVPDDTNNKRDIFLVDRESDNVSRVSVADDGTQGDGDSFSPNIGAGGALVAFDSAAKTLVPDDHKTKGSDIFLHLEDRPAAPGGASQPADPPPPATTDPSGAGQPGGSPPDGSQGGASQGGGSQSPPGVHPRHGGEDGLWAPLTPSATSRRRSRARATPRRAWSGRRPSPPGAYGRGSSGRPPARLPGGTTTGNTRPRSTW